LAAFAPPVVELDWTEERVEVHRDQSIAHLRRVGRRGALDRHLEREAGGRRRGGMLVGQMPELRGERGCVMEAVQEITDRVSGGRCPLRRSHGEVRCVVEIGGEGLAARSIAEAQ